jgi:hypothetical protein
MVFSSILQNGRPKSKFFWGKWETKHPLNTLSVGIQMFLFVKIYEVL